jgi:hypothetical protein
MDAGGGLTCEAEFVSASRACTAAATKAFQNRWKQSSGDMAYFLAAKRREIQALMAWNAERGIGGDWSGMLGERVAELERGLIDGGAVRGGE